MKICTLCRCICLNESTGVWINEWKPVSLRAGCLSWVGMPTITCSPLCCQALLLSLPLSPGQCDQTGSDSSGVTASPSHPHHQFWLHPSVLVVTLLAHWPLSHSAVDFPPTEELPLRTRSSLEEFPAQGSGPIPCPRHCFCFFLICNNPSFPSLFNFFFKSFQPETYLHAANRYLALSYATCCVQY